MYRDRHRSLDSKVNKVNTGFSVFGGRSRVGNTKEVNDSVMVCCFLWG